jgi:hypothetical protein
MAEGCISSSSNPEHHLTLSSHGGAPEWTVRTSVGSVFEGLFYLLDFELLFLAAWSVCSADFPGFTEIMVMTTT